MQPNYSNAAARKMLVPDGALDPAVLPSFEVETDPYFDVGYMLAAAWHLQETR